MELVAGIVASILGTTGAIGLLTASVQLSRRARLRRSIAAAREASDLMDPASANRQMLQQAMETDILRLASMSLVTFGAYLRAVIVAYAGALLAGTAVLVLFEVEGIDLGALLPFESASGPQPFWLRLGTVVLVMVFIIGIPAALLIDFYLQLQRESLVSDQMLQNPGVIMTPDLLRREKALEPDPRGRASGRRARARGRKGVIGE